MKKNRFLALALCLILCLALFAGCSNSNNSNTPATNAPSDTNTPDDSPDTTPAPESRTIKVNSFLTESSPLTDGTKAIVRNITDYTDGEIVAEGYYNGNLIGFFETWEAIGNGTIDMGYIGPVVMDSYSILTNIFSTPVKGLPGEGPVALGELFNELVNACPDFETEFAKHNMKIVWVEALCGTIIHTSKSLVTAPDQLKGLTIEGLGIVSSKYLENLGCTTVSLDVGDYYTSLNNGVIDSFFNSLGSAYNNQLMDLLPYHTVFGTEDDYPSGAGLTTGAMLYCMNLDTWNSLTAEQQEEIVQAAKDGSNEGLVGEEASQKEALAYAAEHGHEFYYVNGEEADQWFELAQPLVDDWIAECNEQGYDGQGIWDTWVQILADYNAAA